VASASEIEESQNEFKEG